MGTEVMRIEVGDKVLFFDEIKTKLSMDRTL
jgi:hypothetical protein